MSQVEISASVAQLIEQIRKRASAFADAHKLEVGAAEMIIGGALCCWGVKTGLVQFGLHVVATKMPVTSALTGGVLSAGAASLVGGIGVVGMGGAIGIPALVVIGGAAAVSSLLGYNIGQIAQDWMDPSWFELLQGPTVAIAGAWLMVDGARRIWADDRLAAVRAAAFETYLELADVSSLVVANTMRQLREIRRKLARSPKDTEDLVGGISSAAIAGGLGAGLGGALAAGSVTVLGSSSLGSAAVALGLAAPPLWPVLACGVAASAVGYGAWKLFVSADPVPTPAHKLPPP